MITNVSKKIICIKDIPSNLIEEAIFILKSDKDNISNENVKVKRKEIIIKEAENFLNEYINENKKDCSKGNTQNNRKYFKNIKIQAVLISVVIASIGYMFFRLF